MGEYTRRAGDKAFRRVHLFVTGVPEFEKFTQVAERVPYDENEVLEVLAEDGTTSLHYYADQKRELYYNFPEREILKITCNGNLRICARLWLRNEGSEVLYKLPVTLPLGKDNKLSARIPGITGSTKLCGDQYFSKVYTIRNV